MLHAPLISPPGTGHQGSGRHLDRMEQVLRHLCTDFLPNCASPTANPGLGTCWWTSHQPWPSSAWSAASTECLPMGCDRSLRLCALTIGRPGDCGRSRPPRGWPTARPSPSYISRSSDTTRSSGPVHARLPSPPTRKPPQWRPYGSRVAVGRQWSSDPAEPVSASAPRDRVGVERARCTRGPSRIGDLPGVLLGQKTGMWRIGRNVDRLASGRRR
jgi:hypothetical protein